MIPEEHTDFFRPTWTGGACQAQKSPGRRRGPAGGLAAALPGGARAAPRRVVEWVLKMGIPLDGEEMGHGTATRRREGPEKPPGRASEGGPD